MEELNFTSLSSDRKRLVTGITSRLIKDYVTSNVIDIVALANRLGFHVYKLTKKAKFIGLITVNLDGKPVNKDLKSDKLIAFDEGLTSSYNRRIIAVELGYYFLYAKQMSKKNVFIYTYRDNREMSTVEDMEVEYFADNLLVPLDKLDSFLKQFGSFEDTVFARDYAARHFDVPLSCIDRRIKELKKHS